MKKATEQVLAELKGWSVVGSDVAALQAHEAVAIFIGNYNNNAKHVAGPLIQVMRDSMKNCNNCDQCAATHQFSHQRQH